METEQNENKRWYMKHYSWQLLILILVCYTGLLALALFEATGYLKVESLIPSEKVSKPEVLKVSPQPESTPSTKLSNLAREKVSILILNGTGIAGQAGKVKKMLMDLGYQEIDTDNADSQGLSKTSLTYKPGLDKTIKTEVVTALGKMFVDVSAKESSSSSSYQIKIVTGQQIK